MPLMAYYILIFFKIIIMTRIDLLHKIVDRKKALGLTDGNIATLSNLGTRTIARFFAGEDVKLSTIEKITQLLGIDFAGNEIIDSKTLKYNRAREKALYLVSLVQDTSSLEQQGLEKADVDNLIAQAQSEFLTGKYQKTLWSN
jgi:transcriptional regulator with XRE-family HTH domain